MSITIRNHYNPCLWTAYWNYDYFHNEELRKGRKARKQKIFSLNLQGNKIFSTTVENVFYEKKMGIAGFTNDSVLDFTKRNFPNEYNDILDDSNWNNLIIDFENFFTVMDDSSAKVLNDIILKNEINTLAEKTHIAFFIVDLYYRNYKVFNDLTEVYKNQKKPKFEFFCDLKSYLSNPESLKKLIIPIISSKWILYKSDRFRFPLCDAPLLINNNNMMLALSPKLLLKIILTEKVLPENICKIKDRISNSNYRDFMKRTIQNSNREIIFNDEMILKKWKDSKVYRNRIKNLKNEY